MCEIFGFSSSKEEELNDYLKEFYSHCDSIVIVMNILTVGD